MIIQSFRRRVGVKVMCESNKEILGKCMTDGKYNVETEFRLLASQIEYTRYFVGVDGSPWTIVYAVMWTRTLYTTLHGETVGC